MSNEIFKTALRLFALLLIITGAAFINATLARSSDNAEQRQQRIWRHQYAATGKIQTATNRQKMSRNADAAPVQPSPEHAAAIQKWLGTKPGLRLATIADCENKYGLQSMRQSYGKAFHPYYLVKDFNGDAVVDFAVALVDAHAKADSQFTLVIFHGAGNSVARGGVANESGAYKVALTQEGLDLRQGGLWAGELVARRTPLYVGVFETDDCTYLKWNGRRYVLQPCEGN